MEAPWCSDFRLVWLMVLEALFCKLRFRIICQMKCRVSRMKFYYFCNPIMFLSRKIFVSFLQNFEFERTFLFQQSFKARK